MSAQLPTAVISSDLHIGDDAGVVLRTAAKGYTAVRWTPTGEADLFVRDAFLRFQDALLEQMKGSERIPYLIINGDGWDVAIRNIDDAARLSQDFFEALRLHECFREILFLPGNHDHHLWAMLETETCVVRPLEKAAGRAPAVVGGQIECRAQPFPHEQSGVLDLGSGGLDIPGVKRPYIGHVFLTGLTGGKLPVNVIYPNLFLRPADGTAPILVTHGHFFELAWRLLTDLLADFLRQLSIDNTLVNLEMLNAPWTEFFNFALAQVGPVSTVVNRIYDGARHGGRLPELDLALNSLANYAERAFRFDGEGVWGQVLATLKKTGSVIGIRAARLLAGVLLRSALGRGKRSNTATSGARNDAHFLDPQETLDFIDHYITMSRRTKVDLPVGSIVFGHTHEPLEASKRRLTESGEICFWNTGGLVGENGEPSGGCGFMPLAIDRRGNISKVI